MHLIPISVLSEAMPLWQHHKLLLSPFLRVGFSTGKCILVKIVSGSGWLWCFFFFLIMWKWLKWVVSTASLHFQSDKIFCDAEGKHTASALSRHPDCFECSYLNLGFNNILDYEVEISTMFHCQWDGTFSFDWAKTVEHQNKIFPGGFCSEDQFKILICVFLAAEC